MSRQATLSDTFDEQLHALLLAAMRYVQRPDSTERHHDYVHASLYEYDTRIGQAIRDAVVVALNTSS
jgi:hypothetical protein